jgi:hypothetical protein
MTHFNLYILIGGGWDGVVGTVTCYGLDNSGFEPQWWWIFPTCLDWPTQPHVQWVWGEGVKWPGHGVNHPPLSSTERKSRATLLFPLWAFMACYRVNFTVYPLSSPFQVFQLKFRTYLLCPNACYVSVHLIFPDLIMITGIIFIQAN